MLLRESIKETTKTLLENLKKNKNSLKKLIGFNIEQFKILFNENWKIVVNLLNVNEEVINKYFSDLDVEIYYGEDQIAHPV